MELLAATFFWATAGLLFYELVGYPIIISMIGHIKLRQSKTGEEHAQNSKDNTGGGALALQNESHNGCLPSISIVVPAYNEEQIIRQKIETLLAIDYPEKLREIVIASDGSSDLTNEMLTAYGENEVRFFGNGKRSGKVDILNKVVPTLKGDIVVFSDASSLLRADALKKLVQRFQYPNVGCVSGFYSPANDSSLRGQGEKLYWKYETFLKRNESLASSILGAHGALYAIRKNLFEPLESSIINDDFVLPMQIIQKGFRAVYEPKAVAFESGETSISGDVERRSRITVGNIQQIFRLKKFLNPFKSIVAFQFVSHKVLRVLNPILLMVLWITSGVLAFNNFLFSLFFFSQLIFCLLGLIGYLLQRFHIKISVFHLPFYFCLGTMATITGLYRSILGKQSITWKRVDI